MTRAPADAVPPPVRTTALLAVLALAGTVFAMMQSLIIPALPRIQVSLGVNADAAAWISTAYLLSACILTPVIGRLALWQVYLATSVIGVGFWLCLVALPNQVVSAVPAARTGSATAVNTVVRNAGGALGVQLAAAIIVSSAHAGTGGPAAAGYLGTLIVCGRRRRRGPRRPRHPAQESPLTRQSDFARPASATNSPCSRMEP